MICYLFQDREIGSDDMTFILPSSQPILQETFYFSNGINKFLGVKSVILCLVHVTNNKCLSAGQQNTYQN